MIVEFAKSFDTNFYRLSRELQIKARQTVSRFINCYQHRRFPKALRVHKCGPFLSLSISMSHRIFVLPITGGVKFVFVGDHDDADRYLTKI